MNLKFKENFYRNIFSNSHKTSWNMLVVVSLCLCGMNGCFIGVLSSAAARELRILVVRIPLEIFWRKIQFWASTWRGNSLFDAHVLITHNKPFILRDCHNFCVKWIVFSMWIYRVNFSLVSKNCKLIKFSPEWENFWPVLQFYWV